MKPAIDPVIRILAARIAHLPRDALDEIERADHVGVDDVLHVLELLVEESLAEPMAGVGEQCIDAPTLGLLEEFVDAEARREVDLHGGHLTAADLQRLHGFIEWPVGGDQEVIPALRGLAGELESDAARGSGDDGKGSG